MKKNLSIFPLLWVMLFDHVSLNMTFPILTLIFFDMQSSLFAPETSHAVRSMWYGLCVAMPHLINIVTTPILSSLSDEFGRKKILILGTFGALLFSLISAFGIVYGMLGLLLLGFVIKGSFSRTNPIAQAAVGDISQGVNQSRQKVLYMGYLQTTIATGAFLGPVIAGYFASPIFFKQLNFSLPFFIAAIFGGVSCLLTIIVFKETLIKQQHTRWSTINWQALKNVFANKDVLSISIVLLLSQMSWSMYYQFIPPILKAELHFDAHQLGLFVGLIAFWLALAASVGVKMLQRIFSLSQMLMISLYSVLIGLILTFVFCSLGWVSNGQILVWLAAIPIAVGDVIAYTCLTALYSDVVAHHEQGKVMGICAIIVALVWSAMGLAGGMLMSIHNLLPLLVAPFGMMLAIVVLKKRFG